MEPVRITSADASTTQPSADASATPTHGATLTPRQRLPLNGTSFCFCSPSPSMPSVDDVARLETAVGFMPSADAGRRAGGDDVARQQRHVLRQVGDELSRR